MSAPWNAAYERVLGHARETSLVGSILSVLEWDERTMLPPAGAEYRAEQETLLARMIHRRWTDSRFWDDLCLLADSPLAADPYSDSGTTIRRLRREAEKRRRLPQRLVEELARAAVLGQQAWEQAREADDYRRFRPHLETMFRLKREQAEALGTSKCLYDALLDDYEPEATTEAVGAVLAELRAQLVPLVRSIAESGRRGDASLLATLFPVSSQEAFARSAASALGFDFRRGRLDVTAHPFCAALGPNDCRITTRYDERFFPAALFGALHEAGHGMYDQGLPPEHHGLPLGSPASLGIHESQSRFWENFIARSRAFWEYFYPHAQRSFPEALGNVPIDAFYFAVNDVRPSLIRVEADEVTYNLHILVRFELEQELLDGRLPLDDLPAAWNAKYREYLGIAPPNDADGVLQDVHWAGGLIGYFPTYTLGNLYAAAFHAQADRDLGGLDRLLSRGLFGPVLDWLREKIHRQGQRYSAAELIERVTGSPLSPQPLVVYLWNKFGPLYGVGAVALQA